jgi:7,8-dihydropterin-6-yl-methyl-4-(beta-D-ribofuranosyl)aminobenzene 5'-phosphate synthase
MNEKQILQMTIVYDNYTFDERLKPDWGFSCFIKGQEQSILFDTGTNGQILLSNMQELGIPPEEIDYIVLSHDHKDHTGGLETLLGKNPNVEVWLPAFFSSSFKDMVRKKGAKIIDVESFQQICRGAYTTGVIQGWIREQSLILDTDKGLVLMTGCAHPRIVNIITKAKRFLNKDIYLALGGFHMAGFDKAEIKSIIDKFRELSVKRVAPCHCSGDETREFFAQEYKDDFLKIGAGAKVQIQ